MSNNDSVITQEEQIKSVQSAIGVIADILNSRTRKTSDQRKNNVVLAKNIISQLNEKVKEFNAAKKPISCLCVNNTTVKFDENGKPEVILKAEENAEFDLNQNKSRFFRIIAPMLSTAYFNNADQQVIEALELIKEEIEPKVKVFPSVVLDRELEIEPELKPVEKTSQNKSIGLFVLKGLLVASIGAGIGLLVATYLGAMATCAKIGFCIGMAGGPMGAIIGAVGFALLYCIYKGISALVSTKKSPKANHTTLFSHLPSAEGVFSEESEKPDSLLKA